MQPSATPLFEFKIATAVPPHLTFAQPLHAVRDAMKRRSLIALSSLLIISSAIGADLQVLIPSGELTDDTPSLELAYPDQMFIARTPREHGGVVDYEVRIYAQKAIDIKPSPEFWEVAMVVRDSKGLELVSTTLDAAGSCTIPPNRNEFRVFRFSIHESLERFTVINISRHNGMRVLFTRYRLPLKSIDHPKAH